MNGFLNLIMAAVLNGVPLLFGTLGEILSERAGTLQTRMAVPASISDIITGIILFCMLGCEFFINYRLIFRHRGKEGAR